MDWCTWDNDYNVNIVQKIREKLTFLATTATQKYTSVLMQGSGTFSVEAVIGTVIPENGKVLIISNGAYGNRMAQIAKRLKIDHMLYDIPETAWPDLEKVKEILRNTPGISHVAVVHCETTTGILNPIKEITGIARQFGKITIVDAMSSFGGIPLDVHDMHIDFLVSSANKCIQGVPGFGFVIAERDRLNECRNRARSLALDLYDQWITMEEGSGKWRYTSPTHVVRAFMQALHELEEEGGIEKRHTRYSANQKILVNGMRLMGYTTLLPDRMHSPFITSFMPPPFEKYAFNSFYSMLKSKGFIIYPGKVTEQETFRIGNIGEVYSADIYRLLETISGIRF